MIQEPIMLTLFSLNPFVAGVVITVILFMLDSMVHGRGSVIATFRDFVKDFRALPVINKLFLVFILALSCSIITAMYSIVGGVMRITYDHKMQNEYVRQNCTLPGQVVIIENNTLICYQKDIHTRAESMKHESEKLFMDAKVEMLLKKD